MSDKSFGDHINRNIVKNPLLSTAVVGLSIDDLTHNAVLLPVAQNPGLIPSQDPQHAEQTVMEPDSNLPSGDAKHTHHRPNKTSSTPSLDIGKKNENIPKAAKTHDDFDVNEYFARLQGTRYVSAPINASQANLEATEDNLEEINLNDVTNEEVHQSITADIAQNFSQLPTVLPQVASAVFSSFSNILSYKSREQTPDAAARPRDPGYQELEFQRPNEMSGQSVKMEVGVRKEVAPPPRECNANTFRITTKKKAYAQIPGLNSGDVGFQNAPSQAPHGLPPTPQSNPSYFMPGPPAGQPVDNQKQAQGGSSTALSYGAVPSAVGSETALIGSSQNVPAIANQPPLTFETRFASGTHSSSNIPEKVPISAPPGMSALQDSNIQHTQNIPPPVHYYSQGLGNDSSHQNSSMNPPSLPPSSSNFSTPQGQTAAIIPPPTMFSNQKRDSKAEGVGKTVLPPSVARRLSANQPIKKAQTVAPIGANIFVPMTISGATNSETVDGSAATNVAIAPPPMFFNPNSSAAPIDPPRQQENLMIQNNSQAHVNVLPPTTFLSPVELTTSEVKSEPAFAPAPSAAQTSNLPPPMFYNPASSTLVMEPTNVTPATSTAYPSLQSSGAPPPLFFNPMSSTASIGPPNAQPSAGKPTIDLKNQEDSTGLDQTNKIIAQTVQSNIEPPKQLFDPLSIITPIPEPPKHVPEPPKVTTGNVNFRMSKKRPQYYSGPIEGVGSISNNVKPVIAPTDATTSFQGAFLTPGPYPVNPVEETQSYIPPSVPIDHATVPFDISRPSEAFVHKAGFGNDTTTEHQIYAPQQSDTAFDFSRQTTNEYNPPKEEAKGFGLIGSLKSKLSSLDINKIQNSVTTFFDPAYNTASKVDPNYQENTSSNPNYGQGHTHQSPGVEIFVPNPSTNNPRSYDSFSQNQNYQYNVYSSTSNTQNYQSPEPFSYYQSQNQNAPYYQESTINPTLQPTTPSWIHQFGQAYDQNSQQPVIGTPAFQMDQSPSANYYQSYLAANQQHPRQSAYQHANISSEMNLFDSQQQRENVDRSNELYQTILANENISKAGSYTLFASDAEPKVEENTSTGFSMFYKDSSLVSDVADLAMADAAQNIELRDSQRVPSIENKEKQTIPRQEINSHENNHATKISQAPLFELSTMLAENNKDGEGLQNKIEDKSKTAKSDVLKNVRRSSASFFDDIGKARSDLSRNNEPDAEMQESDNLESGDLNICETCREVSQPEEEAKDFTSQLIDNITSPIQLSNPVGVPLTESITSSENRGFDSNQCAEITHITEETIEAIQVQTATELLEEEEEDKKFNDSLIHKKEHTEINNYGWCTEDLASQPPVNTVFDRNYSFQPDPNAIGFFSNNSLFFDNIPNNASDEIKAEFNNAKEDSPMHILSRQMSIPSAPPAEDLEDIKSDETSGIDVHLIEQDAKKDFPIFEEFVIEPSETDDDKIEVIERERTSDDPIQDIDTFSNRLEQFKDIQDIIDNDNAASAENVSKNPLFMLPTSTSPGITIASYFDTGNYAAETHYRNSLTSPTSINTFIVGSPNQNIPVFSNISPANSNPQSLKTDEVKPTDDKDSEIQFQRDFVGIDRVPIPQIPDTTTQTKPIATLTYGKAGDIMKAEEIAIGAALPNVDLSQLLQNTLLLEDSKEKQPEFSNVFQAQNKFDYKNRGELKAAPTSAPQLLKLTHKIDKKETASSFPEINPGLDFSQNPLSNLKAPSENAQAPPLPDPGNFFSTSVDTKKQETTSNTNADCNVNRLASYFATPATTADNTKSFFELSQGQDHLRKDTGNEDQKTWENTQSYKSFFDSNHQEQDPNKHEPKVHKTFFELSQNPEAGDTNAAQFTQQQYKEKEGLIKDLTSCNYYTPDTEQTVKTVNYFTVEYNNFSIQNPGSGVNIAKPIGLDKIETKSNKVREKIPKLNNELEETNFEDRKLNEIVNECKYCRELDSLRRVDERVDIFKQEIKFKRTMDNNLPDNPKSETCVNPDEGVMAGKPTNVSFDIPIEDSGDEQISMLSDSRSQAEYSPVKYHWFYRVDCEGKSTWRGFSVSDSKALEDAFQSPDLNEGTLVATDGGRYDVNVLGRLRVAVYWSEKPTNVRRCSWFYKGTTDARYVPYTEQVAEKLEEEYRHGVSTGEWHRRLVLPNSEVVVMHGPGVMVHFLQSSTADAWSGGTLFPFTYKTVYRSPPKIGVPRDEVSKVDHLLLMLHGAGEWSYQKKKIQSTMRPRVVRRGHEDGEIEDQEPTRIDHLLLLCHGVGSACDMRFRAVEEVVDDFRATSLQLIQSHYRNSYDNGIVGRVEVLPISWHATLHSGEGGVDTRLARITLDSIPRLRTFTNDTVLDVLFYTSPVFCQTIVDTVCGELNRIYALFCARNPRFVGGVSLGGHSLGSVILYDLLSHQIFEDSPELQRQTSKILVDASHSKQPSVKYPKLQFEPAALYGLGSPIAMFECIRGVELLGEQFQLPTCPKFYNIFHPYDPIAYRIEPMINPKLKDLPPFLIPHHKGRKRMHLELKETVARVGADLKQKLVESIKATWSSVWRTQPPSNETLEKVVEEEIEKGTLDEDSKEEQVPQNIDPKLEQMLGRLNGGRRVDYVLQEAPFEMINEYLFAMTSHVCYWESEDTMLLILREMYDSIGVLPDSTVPLNTMTVHRTKIITAKEDDDSGSEIASDHASTSGV